jgi:type I restriction enzyme S subunit
MTSAEPMKIPEGYKQTEVGVIPEDWEISSVGEEFDVKLGKMLDADKNQGFDKPYLGNKSVQWGWVDTDSLQMMRMSTSDLKRFRLKAGDLLVCEGGEVGRAAIWSGVVEECYYQKALHRLRPIKGFSPRLMLAYLRYWSDHQLLDDYVSKTSIAHLTREKFISIPMPVASEKEQTAIANALSDVDNLIASLETLITKKSVIKTAAMQQLLTGKKRLPAFVKVSEKQNSELDNTSETAQAAQAKQASTLNSDLYKESAEGLDEKSNQHSEVVNANNKQTAPRAGYKQTELGEIPEDWEVLCVGDSCDLLTGYPFPSDSYSDHGIRLLRGSNVKRGNTDWSEGITQYWPKITADIKQYELYEGDIVISMDGSLVGRSFAQLSRADLPAVLLQRVARLRSTSVSVSFLKEWVCSKFFTEHCDSVKTVTAIPHISPEDIRIFRFLCPPTVEEQTAIANVLSDMDTELDALQQRLSKTQKIKQGMMQELLTGKTRLV